jgi:hypothetical protein
MVDNDSEGLKGDPRRQAVPSLKGYAYQIWHSVYRWITLGKDDVLYLEGAEDLDVLGPEKAEAIQVKDTKRSGSITLRSQDVLEAQYLRQSRKAEGRLSSMNTTQAGDLVENLVS